MIQLHHKITLQLLEPNSSLVSIFTVRKKYFEFRQSCVIYVFTDEDDDIFTIITGK